jgi:hypothetical protein
MLDLGIILYGLLWTVIGYIVIVVYFSHLFSWEDKEENKEENNDSKGE